MSLLTAVLVTAVVWAVGMIRSLRWKALAYSLPLPITLILLSSGMRVDASQIVGVVLLNVFFYTVAAAFRLGLPIWAADLVGIGVYIGLSWSTVALGALPFWPVLAGAAVIWAAFLPFRPPATTTPPATGNPLLRLGVLFAVTLSVVALAGALRGLVVTFPYSGVLVAVEVRRFLSDFARHFTRNSVALLAFFAAHYATQHHGTAWALTAAWAAFAVTALSLNLTRPKAAQVGN